MHWSSIFGNIGSINEFVLDSSKQILSNSMGNNDQVIYIVN